MAAASGKVDTCVVYIREAHPTDSGHFGKDGNACFNVATHASLEERAAAASLMLKHEPLSCRVLLDTMDDDVSRAFNAFPDRLAVVDNGVCVYLSELGPWGFNIAEVHDWLSSNYQITNRVEE